MKIIKLIFLLLVTSIQVIQGQTFLKGADLSFANELQGDNCGIKFKKEASDDSPTDVYQIFKDYGSNVVRARLWVGKSNLISGNYSNIDDVIKTFNNAKKGSPDVKTLLTIHYSDRWADPGEQKTPEAWKDYTSASINKQLRDRVRTYTIETINRIGKGKIDYISIGNETNAGFICPKSDNNCNLIEDSQRYARMKELLQIGINAAIGRGFNKNNIMVHVAGPGNAWWWLEKMGVGTPDGLNNFGLLGLSYYPALPVRDREGHNMSTAEVGKIMKNIIGKYRVRPLIVETSHPYTNDYTKYDEKGSSDKSNRMSTSSPYESFQNLIPQPWKQKVFMERLTNQTYDAGGLGVISWEPAWVSPAKDKDKCTDSGNTFGSDQEHHTFFSINGQHSVIKTGGINFMNLKKKTNGDHFDVLGFRDVVFRLTIPSVPEGQVPHLAVDFNGNGKIDYGNQHNERVKMTWNNTNKAWEATVLLRQGTTYKYRYMNGYNPGNVEKLSGPNCSKGQAIREVAVWNTGGNQIVKNSYGACVASNSGTSLKANVNSITESDLDSNQDFTLAPNPANDYITIQSNTSKIIKNIIISDMTGKQHGTYSPNSANFRIDISLLQKGIYVVVIDTGIEKTTKKLIVK